MSIKDFAEKYIQVYCEAFRRGNVDELEKLEDSNMVHHSVARGQDSLVGWEAHKQAICNMRQAIPDYRPELRYLTGEGNLFAVSYKARGTLTGQAPGYPPPTGKEVTLDYLYIFRVNEGRIIEAWYKGTSTGLN